MDLLQKINNRFRSESGRWWDKLYEFAYGATIGLIKLYRQKTLELVKISATQAYLQVLRVSRKHLLLIFLALFAVVVSAVASVVVPVALVMVSPWAAGTKILVLAVFGLIYAAVAALCLHYLFSEDKWMKISGIQELLDSIKS